MTRGKRVAIAVAVSSTALYVANYLNVKEFSAGYPHGAFKFPAEIPGGWYTVVAVIGGSALWAMRG